MNVRQWAAPIGFIGSAASLVFWALLVPGVLVSVATLLAPQPQEAPATRRGQLGGEG